MKKVLVYVLALSMSISILTGCASSTSSTESAAGTTTTTTTAAAPKNVELSVVTSYGGDDGNRVNYETAVAAYEKDTGNKVKDNSSTSSEEWKAKIMADFQTGAEPDVLFYFTGVDANKIVESGKVVSLDEIRKAYPEFASNMKDELIAASPADGKKYAIPVNGYWEGLFVNKTVLEACGVAVPDANTTWDKFMADCETIKSKGYTPIAASLQEVPHYWFEYTVFNSGSPSSHSNVPKVATDAAGKIWASGLSDIKTMYEKGFFPKNTITASDAETFQLMADNKAAFAIDGSWKMGWFKDNVDDVTRYTITYIPGKGGRKATDIIGGLSMGYYITQKAWSDPAKRDAAVKFVTAMTTDDVVSTFGATAVTALKNGTKAPAETNSFIESALAMTKGATSVVGATQDGLPQTQRTALFAEVKNIASGTITPEKAIEAALAAK
jgi:raffinose/stachyose/melibiose transport system substrate-binding protein